MAVLLLALLLLSLLACDDGGRVGTDPSPCELTFGVLQNLRIDEIRAPSPVLVGTTFVIRGESFVSEGACVTREVLLSGDANGSRVEVPLRSSYETINSLQAVLSPSAAQQLGGSGTFNGELLVVYREVEGNRTFRTATALGFRLADTVSPQATRVELEQVYLNDEVIVSGEGFVGGEEGYTEFILRGEFTADTGEVETVSGFRQRGRLVSADDRGRASFLWSPSIGGLAPGRFSGTLTPENVIGEQGSRVPGEGINVEFSQEETVLFGLEPSSTISLGQIVQFVGRGFIGRTETDEGTTTIRLDGVFTPHDGREEDFVAELAGQWSDGGTIDYTVTVTNAGQFLHSVDFDTHRGVFRGHVTPVLTRGSERYEGIGLETIITLGPVRQVCWVIFLPGFSDSIDLFGLGAVESEVRERIVDVMQELYQPPAHEEHWINVEFRTEEPRDFYPGGYAILEIGGPDPNNLGLFGYDNTPGKDVGNLRLHDHVGGRNALGELDGYGYGGVFVESLLWWSERPPAGDRPPAAPPPEPRFDDIFDPVRYDEVVAGEYPTGADAQRIAEIDLAIRVLSNMVGDTAAHEFGHSLGLAQPYNPNEFHNSFPHEGCLMDSGSDRPFEERARIAGNMGSSFCGENLWYLQDLLPVD